MSVQHVHIYPFTRRSKWNLGKKRRKYEETTNREYKGIQLSSIPIYLKLKERNFTDRGNCYINRNLFIQFFIHSIWEKKTKLRTKQNAKKSRKEREPIWKWVSIYWNSNESGKRGKPKWRYQHRNKKEKEEGETSMMQLAWMLVGCCYCVADGFSNFFFTLFPPSPHQQRWWKSFWLYCKFSVVIYLLTLSTFRYTKPTWKNRRSKRVFFFHRFFFFLLLFLYIESIVLFLFRSLVCLSEKNKRSPYLYKLLLVWFLIRFVYRPLNMLKNHIYWQKERNRENEMIFILCSFGCLSVKQPY